MFALEITKVGCDQWHKIKIMIIVRGAGAGGWLGRLALSKGIYYFFAASFWRAVLETRSPPGPGRGVAAPENRTL